MSVVEEWSVRLAEEVAPDEASLAPLWAEAYLEGGAARRELFEQTGGPLGGFAGDLSAVMPTVLEALAGVGPMLLGLLSSKALSEFMGCIKNALTVVELREKNAARDANKAKASPPEALVPPQDGFTPLRQVIRTLGEELRAAGMSDERAEIVTFRVVKVLLDEPQGASQFVQQLATSAE